MSLRDHEQVHDEWLRSRKSEMELQSLYIAILMSFNKEVQMLVNGFPPFIVEPLHMETMGLIIKAQHRLLTGVKGRRAYN